MIQSLKNFLIFFYKVSFCVGRTRPIYWYTFAYLFQKISPIFILFAYFLWILVFQQFIHDLTLLFLHLFFYILHSDLIKYFTILRVGDDADHFLRAVRVFLHPIVVSLHVLRLAPRFLFRVENWTGKHVIIEIQKALLLYNVCHRSCRGKLRPNLYGGLIIFVAHFILVADHLAEVLAVEYGLLARGRRRLLHLLHGVWGGDLVVIIVHGVLERDEVLGRDLDWLHELVRARRNIRLRYFFDFILEESFFSQVFTFLRRASQACRTFSCFRYDVEEFEGWRRFPRQQFVFILFGFLTHIILFLTGLSKKMRVLERSWAYFGIKYGTPSPFIIVFYGR